MWAAVAVWQFRQAPAALLGGADTPLRMRRCPRKPWLGRRRHVPGPGHGALHAAHHAGTEQQRQTGVARSALRRVPRPRAREREHDPAAAIRAARPPANHQAVLRWLCTTPCALLKRQTPVRAVRAAAICVPCGDNQRFVRNKRSS